MANNLTDEQVTKALKLIKLCKEVPAFKFEDLLVIHNRVSVIKEFILSNPNSKFRTWLIDKGYAANKK